MVRSGSDDPGPVGDEELEFVDADLEDLERDPVSALHDTEAEAGDEAGLTDAYSIDTREARELGVALDATSEQEARLD